MPRRTKEDASRTRMSIIDAARDVFHQHGVGRARLEKVANVAGVTRGAVYHYFDNKIDLFFAMREDVLEKMRVPIDAVLSNGVSDPLEAIQAALTGFFSVLEESPVARKTLQIMLTRSEHIDTLGRGRAPRPGVPRKDRAYLSGSGKGREAAAWPGPACRCVRHLDLRRRPVALSARQARITRAQRTGRIDDSGSRAPAARCGRQEYYHFGASST
jgi:AcrR family transcriptional regulator